MLSEATEMPDSSATYANRWGGQHKIVDLDGPVEYIDFGGPEGAPPIVFVHGLGGMALNWVLVAGPLAQHRRTYAVDLLGHGLTRAADRAATVRNNAKLVRRFIEEVAGGPAIVIGNSMGGLVAAMLAERHPELVAGAVLINPAMPAPMSRPGRQIQSLVTLFGPPARGIVSTRRGRPWTPAQEVEAVMSLCFSDWSRRDPDVFDAHVALSKQRRSFPEVLRVLGTTTRTMMEATAVHRRVRQRFAAIRVPVLLLHGADDRVVDVSAARWAARCNPTWTYVEMEHCGHTPMLEWPADTVTAIEDWITTAKVGQSA